MKLQYTILRREPENSLVVVYTANNLKVEVNIPVWYETEPALTDAINAAVEKAMKTLEVGHKDPAVSVPHNRPITSAEEL